MAPPRSAEGQEETFATKKVGKEIAWDEIKKHNNADDCWIVVRDKVYNVTEFVPRHPGGNHIYINAGNDCTQLFESYHPLYVWDGMLEKYHIGHTAGAGKLVQQGVHFEGKPTQVNFYRDMKAEVEKFFKDNNIRPRDQPAMYFKTFVIMSLWSSSWVGAMKLFPQVESVFSFTFAAALTCALLLGWSMGLIGVAIMHDANHGGYSKNNIVQWFMGATLDLIGASSFMWKQQHNVGHHVFTNVDGVDPDIRVSDPDVRRVTGTHPWRWYHKYQHIYLLFLYGLLAIKSVLVDDFASLAAGKIGRIEFRKMTVGELALFAFGKMFFFSQMVFVPHFVFNLPIGQHIIYFVATELAAGFYLAYVFEVGHIVEGCVFPSIDEHKKLVHRDWAALQAACTANFAHGNPIWDFISGGLNYQIEHHLFPSVSHILYPKIAPIVQKHCKKHGVSYTNYPTYSEAIASHVRVLKSIGEGLKRKDD